MRTLQGSMLLLLLLAVGCVDTYKPVIIVHGLLYGSTEFIKLSQFISKVHPGTQVIAIDIHKDMSSLTSMWKQVNAFKKVISNIMSSHPDGIHLLCFSQGGLICRGILSTIPDHNVHTVISLSAPLAGHFGEPEDMERSLPDSINAIMRPVCFNKLGKKMPMCSYWNEPDNQKYIFPYSMMNTLHRFCYRRIGQRVSICNYWNDPHHRASYLRGNNFLPLLNGERPHKHMTAWKRNFLRIKKLVLIGGPDDDVITPWQSSCFGFYDRNNNIVEMRNQKFYKDDSFGLRTLDERGDVSVCVHSGVKHIEWHSNFTVFESCMEKWLT